MSLKKELSFKCNWPGCGHEFKQLVGRSGTSKETQIAKPNSIPSTITCPKCGNNLRIQDTI
jgi:rubredoxin